MGCYALDCFSIQRAEMRFVTSDEHSALHPDRRRYHRHILIGQLDTRIEFRCRWPEPRDFAPGEQVLESRQSVWRLYCEVAPSFLNYIAVCHAVVAGVQK